MRTAEPRGHFELLNGVTELFRLVTDAILGQPRSEDGIGSERVTPPLDARVHVRREGSMYPARCRERTVNTKAIVLIVGSWPGQTATLVLSVAEIDS